MVDLRLIKAWVVQDVFDCHRSPVVDAEVTRCASSRRVIKPCFGLPLEAESTSRDARDLQCGRDKSILSTRRNGKHHDSLTVQRLGEGLRHLVRRIVQLLAKNNDRKVPFALDGRPQLRGPGAQSAGSLALATEHPPHVCQSQGQMPQVLALLSCRRPIFRQGDCIPSRLPLCLTRLLELRNVSGESAQTPSHLLVGVGFLAALAEPLKQQCTCAFVQQLAHCPCPGYALFLVQQLALGVFRFHVDELRQACRTLRLVRMPRACFGQ
eukprot:3279740-Prymnesium_polylepis.4